MRSPLDRVHTTNFEAAQILNHCSSSTPVLQGNDKETGQTGEVKSYEIQTAQFLTRGKILSNPEMRVNHASNVYVVKSECRMLLKAHALVHPQNGASNMKCAQKHIFQVIHSHKLR